MYDVSGGFCVCVCGTLESVCSQFPFQSGQGSEQFMRMGSGYHPHRWSLFWVRKDSNSGPLDP